MSGQVGDSGGRQGGRRGCSTGLAPTLLSASHPASDCSLLLPARSAAPLPVRAGVRPGSVLHRAALPTLTFLRAGRGLPSSPRASQTCRNGSPLPPCPAPRTNTVVAREPKGLAMRNRCLPETCQPWLRRSSGSPLGSRGGAGHCRAPLSVWLPEPGAGRSGHFMPLSQETVTPRTAPSQASRARELWVQ